MYTMKKITTICILALCLLGIVVAGAGYSAWNAADPKNTCAQCHEVRPAHQKWQESAHSTVACVECHGTAISNGLHSLKEKAGMVFKHFGSGGKIKNSDIKMSEAQILEVSRRCASCHEAEFAKWKSGAHSTTYENIFEDKIHNKMERPYWDCLRCHGMFYDGNIETLMSLEGDCELWKIKSREQASRPSIPCLACHQIHSPKPRLPDFKNCFESKTPACKIPATSLYVRTEKMHLRSDKLAKVKMYLDGRPVKTSDDPNHWLCMQCHSPNNRHMVRSQDDRTPVGAHEGFSCLACHDPHSNSAAASCAKCHEQSDHKYRFKPGKCPVFAKSSK